MMVRSSDARRAPRLAAALLGTTILAGLSGPTLAQQPSAPAAAPAPPASAAQPAEVTVIRSITVLGAQRLEPETVLTYTQLRIGQPYSQGAADQALKDLYATELFANVRIHNEGGAVTIDIKENPVVNRIILEGNKRIKDDKILPEIKVSARQIFTRSKVRADVERIIELYKRQGRFAATVEPKMVMLDQNRVDIVFEISEGPKSKVRKINIIGNQEFSDSDLRGQMVTKQARFFRLFSSGTSYDPDRLAFDQQKLRQFYLTNGYADFRVVSAVAELTPDKRDFIITYVVEEGKRYKFGDVKVESELRDFSSEGLTRQLPMQKGDWYNAKQVEDTLDKLNQTAGTFGYAFADARPEYQRNPDNLTMSVTFVIAQAPRVYVERIDVNGNTLTQDKVIRREFRLAEGDAFNSIQVKRSTDRIKSLGYFQEKFEVEQKPGSAPDRIVLEANVEEKPTGQLQLSAGYSSIERLILQASIQQNNFRGRGQTIGLSGSLSKYAKSIETSFTEPYLFDRNVSLGIDVYRRDLNSFDYTQNNNRNQTYNQSTTGFQARLGVPLTEYMTVVGRYTLNYDDVSLDKGTYYDTRVTPGVEQCDPLIAGYYLCDAVGKRLSSILGASLIYDTLDNRVRPTRGFLGTLGVDFAGLGGDVRYGRVTAKASKYFAIGRGFVLSLQAEGGAIHAFANNGLSDEQIQEGTDPVRITDRFFLGEPQISGFDIRGVGPRVIRKPYVKDSAGNYVLDPKRKDWTDDALGGKYYYLGRVELEIPLGSGARELGLRPSIFADIGSVWGLRNPRTSSLDPNQYPNGLFVPKRDKNGQSLYAQITKVDKNCTAKKTIDTPNPINTSPPACLLAAGETSIANTALGTTIPAFQEFFYGDTWKPRVSVGIGVNWNSPFGPFRIDIAKALVKQPGDDTKLVTFNVGTQF